MTAPEPVLIDGGVLLKRLAIAVFVLVVVFGAAGLTFRTELFSLGRVFVDNLGGWGVALGFLIPDATNLPIPHEAFSAFGLLGGLSFWTVTAWASVGSLSGGWLGYGFGRLVARTAWYARLVAGHAGQADALVRRYGVMALAIGATLPLPYSLTAWAAGALKMRPLTFGIVSMLRIPRVAFYLWLIQIGFMEIPG